MTEFSKLLKECRQTINQTQHSLSKQMNIAKAELAMYETGMRFPKEEKFNEFDKHFNFHQFEVIREAVIDKITDYMEEASMYDLFHLEYKLELMKLKK